MVNLVVETESIIRQNNSNVSLCDRGGVWSVGHGSGWDYGRECYVLHASLCHTDIVTKVSVGSTAPPHDTVCRLTQQPLSRLKPCPLALVLP